MRGTATLGQTDVRIDEARVGRAAGHDVLIVRLRDGRLMAMPIWLYPTLMAASPRDRRNIEIMAAGRGLRWPDLDLDLSAAGMLAGRPDFTVRARELGRSLRLKDYQRMLTAFSRVRRAG